MIRIYKIARCAYKIDESKDKICNHEIHIHLKLNKAYVKKIRNRCVHVGDVNGGRVRDLEGIVFKTDKKKEKKE